MRGVECQHEKMSRWNSAKNKSPIPSQLFLPIFNTTPFAFVLAFHPPHPTNRPPLDRRPMHSPRTKTSRFVPLPSASGLPRSQDERHFLFPAHTPLLTLAACLPPFLPASLPHTLPCARPHWLRSTLPPAFTHCLLLSRTHCLAPSLTACLPPSLTACFPPFLPHSCPAFMPPSLHHCLPSSLPPSRPAYLAPSLPSSRTA